MNGKRCKAIKRAVKAARGYGPNGMTITAEKDGLVQYNTSEWRRLKKVYKRERSIA